VVLIRIYKISEIFSREVGEKIATRGWIYRKREFSNKIFIIIRDSTDVIQCVIEKNNGYFNEAKKAGIESSIIVEGIVREDPRAPKGKELHLLSLKVIGDSVDFPITKYASREFLLDIRHLAIRSRRLTAIFKIRDTVFRSVHEYFRSNGYYEVQCPMFITAAVEGGATLFPVEYFNNKKVYLTQSSQFYLEALIYSLEKVYTIAPSFRAEKSRTRRHLTEFWHAEAELAWSGIKDIMVVEENLITYVIQKVLENNIEELKFLGRKISKLEDVKPPFYRMTYDEVIEWLNRKGIDIKWGEDLGADEERIFTSNFDKPIFVYGYPTSVKAFYHKNDPNNDKITLSTDLLAPEGYGEIIGGGERIESEQELINKIISFGLDPNDYKWYIDLRKYGSVPHAGFGLGMDRLVMWITGVESIIDTLPFPRTIRRVFP